MPHEQLLRLKLTNYVYTIMQFEALRYKPEGCGFDSRWCHWKFLLT